MGIHLKPVRCCCEGVCAQVADAFDRSNNPSLGANWEEIADADWEIEGSNLYNPTGNGRAIVTSTIPTVGGFRIIVETVNEGSSGNWRIIANYDPVTGYYHYANFSRSSATVCALSVGYHGASGDVTIDSHATTSFNTVPLPCTQLADTDSNSTRVITLCVSGRGIYAFATMPSDPSEFYHAWGALGGPFNASLSRAGLASLSGSPTRFDNFDLYRDTTDLTVAPCVACPCHCGGSYISNAHTLLITIANASGICANLQGVSFELARGFGCTWRGVVTLGGTAYCAVFTIDSDGTGHLNGIEAGCFSETAAGTCNPINVTFPGARNPAALCESVVCGCTTEPLCCGAIPPYVLCPGQFDWVVTEAP